MPHVYVPAFKFFINPGVDWIPSDKIVLDKILLHKITQDIVAYCLKYSKQKSNYKDFSKHKSCSSIKERKVWMIFFKYFFRKKSYSLFTLKFDYSRFGFWGLS